MAGHAATQAIRLLSNLIMTRALTPEMFGVMSIAIVVQVGLAMFSDLGLRQSLIQSRHGTEPEFANTAWSLQVIRGGLMMTVMLVFAAFIGLAAKSGYISPDSAYANDAVPWAIAAISLSCLISGFESTRLIALTRQLDMKKSILMEVLIQAICLAFMCIWVSFSPTVWALIGGLILASILRTTFSHTLIPGLKNRFSISKIHLNEILSFGKWIFIMSIIGFLSSSGDKILAGAYLSAAKLGQLAIASLLIAAITEVYSKLISQVGFPAFSACVRETPELLKDKYYKLRKPVDISSLLGCGILFSAGHLITDTLYDDRYKFAGHLFEILSLTLFEVRFSLVGQCLLALGRSKSIIPMVLTRTIVIFIGAPLAYWLFGEVGFIWAIGTSILFTIPVNIYYKYKINLLDIPSEIRWLWTLPLGWAIGQTLLRIYH